MTDINHLIECVHKFFPIESPETVEDFSGTDKKRQLVRDKINDILENKDTPWKRLITSFSEYDPNYPIDDLSYLQIPSYEANVLIESNTEFIAAEYKKEIVVNLSLLHPVYTIFYRDTYKFKFKEPVPLHHNIYLEDGEGKDDLVERIKNLITEIFPDYTLQNHYLLFKRKIFGYDPLGYSNTTIGYPLYNFLFDETFETGHINVLK